MGSSCTVSWSSDLDQASKEIKQQLCLLEANISKADLEIREHVAKANIDPLAHQRALNAMKKKKLFEEQRRQLIGAQFNVESLACQRDQARVTLNAVKALEAGTKRLKADQLKMDPTKVEDLCDDAQNLADEMRCIGDTLAATYDLNEDAAEALDKEYLQFDMDYARLAAVAGHKASAQAAFVRSATDTAGIPAQRPITAIAAATSAGGAPLRPQQRLLVQREH